MPHLELNEPGWIRLATDCNIHSIDDLADLSGLDPGELRDVIEGRTYPDTRFVAALLGAVPASFNDLFVVKVPSALGVA